MGAPTILKPREHHQTITYEGTGKGQKLGRFLPFTDLKTFENSLMFDDEAGNEYLYATPSAAGNRRKHSFSCWFKKGTDTTATQPFFSAYGSNSDSGFREIRYVNDSITYSGYNTSYAIFYRDYDETSQWFHLLMHIDIDNSTASQRVRAWVNGIEQTQLSTDNRSSLSGDSPMCSTISHRVGSASPGSVMYDGYMADVHFFDGTLVPVTTLGQTDTTTGTWIAKDYSGLSYGVTGFNLKFANTAGQTLGYCHNDNTANNYMTVSNMDVQKNLVKDTPSKNYPVLADFQESYKGNYANGNLRMSSSTHGQTSLGRSTISFDVQDANGYYFETKNMATSSFGSNFHAYGIVGVDADGIAPSSGSLFPNGGSHVLLQEDGNVRIRPYTGAAEVNLGASSLPKTGNTSTRDVIGVAVKAGKVWFSKNGIWGPNLGSHNQGNPNSNGKPAANNLTGRFRFCCATYDDNLSEQEVNFGQRREMRGTVNNNYVANNGGFFKYDPPAGFRALTQDEVPSSNVGVTDFAWLKNRETTDKPTIFDSMRNYGKARLETNDAAAESDQPDAVQKFLGGGIHLEDYADTNRDGDGHIAHFWSANGFNTSANTQGSGATVATTFQVNPAAKFSMGTWEKAGGSNPEKIQHGLGVAPEFIIMKIRDASSDWFVYHHSINSASGHYLKLQSTDGTQTGSDFGSTAPGTTTFSSSATGVSGRDLIFYAWAGVKGYSRFGKYSGNGNANGPFIHLGFKPKTLIVKSTSSGTNWELRDTARNPTNPVTHVWYPGISSTEYTTDSFEFFSNGFKIISSGGGRNDSGKDYVYAAWAEIPMYDGLSFAPAH